MELTREMRDVLRSLIDLDQEKRDRRLCDGALGQQHEYMLRMKRDRLRGALDRLPREQVKAIVGAA